MELKTCNMWLFKSPATKLKAVFINRASEKALAGREKEDSKKKLKKRLARDRMAIAFARNAVIEFHTREAFLARLLYVPIAILI